ARPPSQAETTPQTSRSGVMVTEAEQVVSRFVAAWGRADVDELLDYFTDDAVWHPMPMSPIVGKAALREAVKGWIATTVDGGVEMHEQVSDGTIVMHERTDRFSFDGQEHALPVCAVFEIENGRIAAWREYFDASSYGDSDDSQTM